MLAALVCQHSIASAQQVFFEPREPQAPWTHVQGDPDWDGFFRADAPWRRAASHIQVLNLTAAYVSDASDDDLRAVAAGLAARRIDIDIPLQSVAVERDEPCGKTEGYDEPAHIASVAAKLKRLGITPRYISLDGPLWFGHYDTGPKACRFSIDEAARRAARSVRIFLAEFPDLAIDDIEGSVLTMQPSWQAGYSAFKAQFEAEAGHALNSLTLDVKWSSPGWDDSVKALSAMAKSLEMKFGVIYNGDERDDSDGAWISHAIRNFTTVESREGIIPDIASFASWNPFPTRALPETSPGAHTWLINQYRLPRTRFEVERDASGWHVRLVDAGGHPVSGQNVAIQRLGVEPAEPPPTREAAGTVPPNATGAILGLRVNAECFCAGDNDLVVGELVYREDANGSASQKLSVSALAGKPRSDGAKITPVPIAGAAVVRLRVTPDRQFLLNSPAFPVTPGAHYVFTAPLGAIDADGLYGTATIIWLDHNGNGISRTNILDPGDRLPAGAATTDANGAFSLPASTQVRELSFAGTATMRPALARLGAAAGAEAGR
jgi:hypothetical protein